jgi:hypothetical protein
MVSYGYQTWSRTLGEKHKQTAFVNRLITRIAEPKKMERYEDEVLNGEDLHKFYAS